MKKCSGCILENGCEIDPHGCLVGEESEISDYGTLAEVK